MAAAKDLITNARALQCINNAADPNSFMPVIVTAISDAIEKYLGRRILSKAYDEVYNGNGDRRLILRQYPIQKVSSVRYRPVTVLKIINNNTSLNQQARVAVTSTGLSLTRVASGVSSTDNSVTFASNVTLAAVVTAVNALGNGWSASYVGDSNDYGSWPSADLYIPGSFGDALEGAGTLQSQGALTARGTNAELKMHTYELSGYQWDPRGWLLRAIPYSDPELLHPEDLIWPIGINNFRIQYTAGYTTVPEAIQEACGEWCAICWFMIQHDPGLSTSVTSSTSQSWLPFNGQPPEKIRALLAPFRRLTIANDQG
jgi:hypothetical protein